MMIIPDNTTYLPKRDKLLEFLLTGCSNPNAGYTIKEIAENLKLSIAGVRHYLVTLEKEGLIARSERQGRAGRPATIYSLSKNAQNSFPKKYEDFTLNLIGEIESNYGKEEINKFLEKLGRKSASEIRNEIEDILLKQGKDINNIPLKQKLEEITKALEKREIFPFLVEKEDHFILKNFNCLLYNITVKNPLVCKLHETMVNELTNGFSRKESCIAHGDSYCLFRIDKFSN